MSEPRSAVDIFTGADLLSRLASIEHERWAHWQRYVHDQGTRQPDGSLLLPSALVARWDEQIETPYSQLSADEQRSDQDQVQRYLPTIRDALAE
ncbi:hypothetical protein ACTHQN_06085 [Curtobacterium flaccumfaciens]|uniref:hypothetical protein n=1 Tax=Curtobacterium flaccumfaciens TaxID=2035 RepID=UPI003F7E9AA4